MKNIVKLFLISLLFVFTMQAEAQVASTNATLDLLYLVNSTWRSSSANIDEQTLREEMIGTHPPRFEESLLVALAATPLEQIVATLDEAAKSGDTKLLVNKEVAINIIKIKIIADHLMHHQSAAPHNDLEIIAGYSPEQLSRLVKNLPSVTAGTQSPNEFDFLAKLFERELAHNNIFKNDLYVFKIAYAFWEMGLVPEVKLVSEVMIRGNGEMALLSAVGQDDVMRSLKLAKFSHRQVEYLKKVPGFEKADPRFFEALLKWRFSGDVYARKPGTLISPGSSYMLMIGNIFDILFAEAPSLAHVALAVGTGTLASRMVRVANGRPLVEGGTRRYLEGYWRAKYAFINGFIGTSNVEAAHQMGIEPMGSGGNHASVGLLAALLGDEMDFHLSMSNVFDYRPLRYLADTFNMRDGIRKILRGTRGEAGGARSDSDIPGKNTVGTLFDIAEIFKAVGFKDADRPKISHTDNMNEYALEEIGKAGAPMDSGLVGGRLAYAPNLSPVMKAVAVIGADGKMHPISKTADPAKSHYPMPKMVGRKTENGKYVGDTAVLLGQALPEGYEPELDLYMKDGEFVKALPTIAEQRKTHDQELQRMPPEALDIHAKPGIYPFTYSAELQNIRQEYVKEHDPSQRERVGIYPGSFDGTHDAHVKVAERMKALYGLDRVIIVPTGNASIKSLGYKSKQYRLSAAARVSMLRRKFKDLPWVTIYEGEAKSPTPLTTYQNVKAIEQLLPQDAEIYVMLGQDLLTPMAHFANAKELLEEYNIVFAERGHDETQSTSTINTPAELAQLVRTNHIVRDKAGNLLRTPKDEKTKRFNVLELQPLRTESDSSSALRKFYDGAETVFTLHATNPHQNEPLAQMDTVLARTSHFEGAHHAYGPVDLDALHKIDPYKILPNFHLGWDLEKEMKAQALLEAKAGYDVYVIVDSAAGSHARQSAVALREMSDAGVKFISTQEYLDFLKFAEHEKADWSMTLNYLAGLKARSVTQHFVLEELNNNFFWSSDGAGPCVMVLENLRAKK